MCRRCGEPDKRGPAADRRRRKLWLLSPASLHGGDAESVPCWNDAQCGTRVTYDTMEVDRMIPGWQCRDCGASKAQHKRKRHPFHGGTYRRENIRPSCRPCNRNRNRGNPWGHTTQPEQVKGGRGCLTR